MEAPQRIEREFWTLENAGPGRLTVRLRSFAHFDAYIRSLDFRSDFFVWRGHASTAWRLSTSLDRLRERASLGVHEALTANHLKRFKLAARGRLGGGASPQDDDEWWALGQHYGLATPLLDWTASPFVASFFAYQEEVAPPQPLRCIHGLSRKWVTDVARQVSAAHKGEGRAPVVEFVDPFTHGNPRLVAQEGIFTRSPDGVSIEDYVALHVRSDDRCVQLLRIEFPDAERPAALSHLAALGVSHKSLFPDLHGASLATNTGTEYAGHSLAFYYEEPHARDKGAESSPLFVPPPDPSSAVDRVRSSLRLSEPYFEGPGTFQATYVARDAAGRPLPDVPVSFGVPESACPIPNPFATSQPNSSPPSS